MDPINILLFVMLGLFVFTMFRRNKKTKEQAATLQSQFAPGVEVMTSFGLFGRIVEIDDDENKVLLELSPGNTATVHRQAVTKIVEPVVVDEEPAVVPDDASSLTIEKTDGSAPVIEAPVNGAPVNGTPVNETPDETLRRLNDEGKKGS
ncbi:preprotein translocase subunit YajC [Arthrobacter sp. CG_A4]|nr:preprotein translocase subunit YajC [Arthrobacter sp. CG_A4]